MFHRHLDYPEGTPVEQLGPAALDDLLDRGTLKDWQPLARAVASDPWGGLAETILHLCDAHPMYGTSNLWRAYIASLRAMAMARGRVSGRGEPEALTLAELRMNRGQSQEEVGERLGMNQSEVSKLERRADVRVSTLRSFVAALGGQLHLMVSWRPGGPSQVELSIPPSQARK
jgi:DNA-binding Xre family transcriptional regulator